MCVPRLSSYCISAGGKRGRNVFLSLLCLALRTLATLTESQWFQVKLLSCVPSCTFGCSFIIFAFGEGRCKVVACKTPTFAVFSSFILKPLDNKTVGSLYCEGYYVFNSNLDNRQIYAFCPLLMHPGCLCFRHAGAHYIFEIGRKRKKETQTLASNFICVLFCED